MHKMNVILFHHGQFACVFHLDNLVLLLRVHAWTTDQLFIPAKLSGQCLRAQWQTQLAKMAIDCKLYIRPVILSQPRLSW